VFKIALSQNVKHRKEKKIYMNR